VRRVTKIQQSPTGRRPARAHEFTSFQDIALVVSLALHITGRGQNTARVAAPNPGSSLGSSSEIVVAGRFPARRASAELGSSSRASEGGSGRRGTPAQRAPPRYEAKDARCKHVLHLGSMVAKERPRSSESSQRRSISRFGEAKEGRIGSRTSSSGRLLFSGLSGMVGKGHPKLVAVGRASEKRPPLKV